MGEVDGIPAAWAEGVARFAAMACPRPALADEWPTLVADARAFLDSWGPDAARLGWPAWALWGVHRDVPGSWRGRELVALLHGRPVVALTEKAATIRTGPGRALIYPLRPRDPLHPAERTLLWELL